MQCFHDSLYRARLDDRDPQELLGCRDRRGQTAPEVRLVTEARLASLECPGLRVRRAPLGLMVLQVLPVPPDPTVPQETAEFPDCRDQQVLSGPGDLPGRRESAEWPGRLGRRDRLVLLGPRDLLDLWAPGGREERRDHRVNLELLVWAAGLGTRGLLALLDLSALRALRDFR